MAEVVTKLVSGSIDGTLNTDSINHTKWLIQQDAVTLVCHKEPIDNFKVVGTDGQYWIISDGRRIHNNYCKVKRK